MSNPPESLGSNYTDPLLAYEECVFQEEGLNADMQGYAVRLSYFLVNVCLALLIRYSDKDVAEPVNALLLQIYTLLCCTFISFTRKQLSVADAYFSLTLTISPLALYLVYASLRKVLRKSSYLFRRLGDHYKTSLTLSVLMLPLWIIIHVLIYFDKVFSHTCPHITFRSWFIFEAEKVEIAFIATNFFTGFIVFVWFVYFLRHFTDIRNEYRRHKMKAPHDWKWFGWLRWFPLSFKSLMIAQRDVIIKCHPWVLTLSIWTAYVIWGYSLFLDVWDMHEFYNDLVQDLQTQLNGTTTLGPYTPPAGYKPLGFGQLLAAALAFPPLWKVMCMIWTSREKLLVWVKGYPASLWNGTVFLFTGRRNPWLKKVLETRAGSHPTESPSDSIPMTGPNDKVQSLENVLASLPTQEKSMNRSESA
ncbi:hypothetical protein C8R42DRAFT_256696 [Lentinula raphanica]|nr:hypothetical protein C8R42DRAFT_256696 [Lentinula raphanica]